MKKVTTEVRLTLPKPEEKSLKMFNNGKRHDVSIIFWDNREYIGLKNSIPDLLNKIIENKHLLTELTVACGKNLTCPEKLCLKGLFGHLETLRICNSSLETKRLNLIFKLNPKLKHVDLSVNDKISWKDIKWDYMKNLEELALRYRHNNKNNNRRYSSELPKAYINSVSEMQKHRLTK